MKRTILEAQWQTEYANIRTEAQRATARGQTQFVWPHAVSMATLLKMQDAGHEVEPLIEHHGALATIAIRGYRIKLNPLGFRF